MEPGSTSRPQSLPKPRLPGPSSQSKLWPHPETAPISSNWPSPVPRHPAEPHPTCPRPRLHVPPLAGPAAGSGCLPPCPQVSNRKCQWLGMGVGGGSPSSHNPEIQPREAWMETACGPNGWGGRGSEGAGGRDHPAAPGPHLVILRASRWLGESLRRLRMGE